MAFENVNVTELKSAINNCKNAINYSTTSELIENISSTGVWQTNSKNNLSNALTRLKNTRFKDLEVTLDKYLEVVNYIEQYQRLDSENKKTSKNYSNLIKEVYQNSNTNNNSENEGILKQLDLDKKKINKNKEQMEIIKNNIANLI